MPSFHSFSSKLIIIFLQNLSTSSGLKCTGFYRVTVRQKYEKIESISSYSTHWHLNTNTILVTTIFLFSVQSNFPTKIILIKYPSHAQEAHRIFEACKRHFIWNLSPFVTQIKQTQYRSNNKAYEKKVTQHLNVNEPRPTIHEKR